MREHTVRKIVNWMIVGCMGLIIIVLFVFCLLNVGF